MGLNIKDQTRIRDYLLGKLDGDEQERIEERLMLEEDLFQELDISKAELIEEYRAADLPHEERQWFEQHFLASPEGRLSYAMVAALEHLGSSAPETSPDFSLFERIKNFFGPRHWVLASASGAALALIVAAVLLSPTTGQSVVGPTLASNVLNREEGRLPARFTIPANASEIKFRLLLSGDTANNSSYRAELDNKIQVQPVKVLEYDREGLWVAIPATQLPRGEYSLKVVAVTSGGTEREIPGDYLFNIE